MLNGPGTLHGNTFKELERLLTQAAGLMYFDPAKERSIQCDTSGQSLGAALLQGGKPLAYASTALANTERRYATIEKKILAIMFPPCLPLGNGTSTPLVVK